MPLLTPVFAGGSFSATRDISVNLGTGADRGLLVLVFNEGNITPGGTPITSCVLDPAGVNLPLTGGVGRDSVPIISPGGQLRAFWLAGASVPTGVRTVRVTCADGNGKPQIWALPFDGFTAISAETLANGSTANPSITVPSASGRTVVAMVHSYAHPDTATMSPTAPATLVRRVLLADNPLLVGAIWQEAGAASTVVDGTWTSPNAQWGVVGWSLTPSAGDTTPPTLTGAITQGATTSSTIAITWPTGTDNVAVTGYDVSQDGGTTWLASNGGTATTTAHTFSGLTASTAYAIRVRAKDAAGNLSTPVLSASFSTSAAGGGSTITSRPLVRNTGASAIDPWALWGPAQAFTAFVHNVDTGALVVKSTGLLTSAAAVLTITNAAIAAAPAYRVDFLHEATGVWGMDILPAV